MALQKSLEIECIVDERLTYLNTNAIDHQRDFNFQVIPKNGTMNRIGKATTKAREAVFVEFQPSATGNKNDLYDICKYEWGNGNGGKEGGGGERATRWLCYGKFPGNKHGKKVNRIGRGQSQGCSDLSCNANCGLTGNHSSMAKWGICGEDDTQKLWKLKPQSGGSEMGKA
ncbi:hypothetical protein B0H14DRAFT_2592710 [Mycena olivaceomarginata]|nr:hypothetical protein B0H14DRAFT_2633276 [Mycena olivaceomarginata]KAJ7831400.1 hypothetical protein B0H14DRAFT_2592710 [Mycena olivaceomarginata]